MSMEHVGGNTPPPGGDITGFLQEFAQVSSERQLGLANLQQLTDTMMKKGYLTTEEIAFLKQTATDMIAPSLSPPDQKLVQNFLDKLGQMVGDAGGSHRFPIGATKNAWLNCSAVLALFIMTSNVIGLLSKIQLAENLYKAKLALVMKDMASAAFSATVEAGKIEREKELAQAAKAAADAGLAIGQMAISITMMVATQIEMKRVEQRLVDSNPELKDKPLPPMIRQQITTEVDAKMRPLQSSLDGMVQAMRSLNEAKMHTELADLDVEAAIQRATGELLNKLMDIVSQSVSMLAKSAETDIPKTIQALLEQMTTAIRTYGQAWEQRG